MTAATGQALENAIVANPDDLGAHAAYADWLIEQGDPRGEFIQVQLALEDERQPAEERARLQARERELLAQHSSAWLGGLAQPLRAQKECHCDFARGWLRCVRTHDFNDDLARTLASEPAVRLLRRLEIVESENYEIDLETLAHSNFLGNLRVFQLGQLDTEFNCRMLGGNAVDLVAKLPRIEELYLLAHFIDCYTLFGLNTLQHLRVLQVDHQLDYPLDVLASNAALGNLNTLKLHPHAPEGELQAHIRLDGLRAIARAPYLKALQHLHLHCTDFGDAGCQEILDTSLLKRLKSLDLRHGAVTDRGAKALAGCPDLVNLDFLDLNRNCLTRDGIRALKAVKPIALVDDQCTAQEIREQMYLFEADME